MSKKRIIALTEARATAGHEDGSGADDLIEDALHLLEYRNQKIFL